jgi:hypothetical protein
MWQKYVNELLEQFSGNCAFMNACQSCVGVVFKFGWLWLNPTFVPLQKHLGEKESMNQQYETSCQNRKSKSWPWNTNLDDQHIVTKNSSMK